MSFGYIFKKKERQKLFQFYTWSINNSIQCINNKNTTDLELCYQDGEIKINF